MARNECTPIGFYTTTTTARASMCRTREKEREKIEEKKKTRNHFGPIGVMRFNTIIYVE